MPDAQGPSTLRSPSTASAQPRSMPRARHAAAALATVAALGFGTNAQAVQPPATAAQAAIAVSASTSVLLEAAKALEATREQSRNNARADAERTAHAQAKVLQEYIADKYRVSASTVGSVIETAWNVGGSMQMDPLLLLAVVAIESSFNPRAESGRGAQGLMQVMTRIHRDKFEPFGGIKTAWHPEVNMNVGAQILQECINRRGSVPAGLTCYVGSPGSVSSYGRKVLAERDRLRALLPEAEVLTASAPGESDSTLSLAAREGDIGNEPVEITASLTQRDLTSADM